MSRPLFAVPITIRLGADEQAEDEKQREPHTARRLDDRPFLVLEFYETTQKVVLHECRSNAAPHVAAAQLDRSCKTTMSGHATK